MSNLSLKEQLEAVAAQFSSKKPDSKPKPKAEKKPHHPPKTPKPSKPKWLEEVLHGVSLLRKHFPACFKATGQVQPLKKGIKQDLISRLNTMESISVADRTAMIKSVAYYVNKVVYHKSVKEQAIRIDLDGQPAGVVTAEEAQYSLDRQQAKQQSKAKDVVTP